MQSVMYQYGLARFAREAGGGTCPGGLSAGLGLAPPAEVTGRSPKTRKQERRGAALGTDIAQCGIIIIAEIISWCVGSPESEG